jgi:dTDP-4-dehydrorhamnose 3,5-epimerase-like enzyme/dTDP-4-dehydrorhamnose reductase
MEKISTYIDERGELLFLIKNNNFTSIESTISINKKNVFRGLHSNKFSKMVTCIQGSILDIIVNLDINDEKYLIPQYFNLSSASDFNQIIVPPNYAHGFLSLEENTIIVYHLSNVFIQEETCHIHYQDPCINIKLPIDIAPVISEKDNIRNFIKPIDYVIIGSSGYLGNHITNILKIQGKNVITISNRLSDLEGIKKKLSIYSPKNVINAAGISNVDWCDSHKEETIETNITYQLTLCHICKELGIHLILFGTGGIFYTQDIHFEEEMGNYYEKFYSESRIYLEKIIINYKNVLYLRINYPISSCLNPKNLLEKIKLYNKISNSEISVTCVDTLFPLLSTIIENKEIGIMNFVNTGTINLVDIKKKYNILNNISDNYEVIDINYRPPIILDTTRIEKYNPKNIIESIDQLLLKTIHNNILLNE